MRILRIRFKNLNSLVGEWDIDLAHPSFASDGIFAITGPTGAGKTTILDALCLALYGRTPRLSKVSKTGNEIMSRQTGECFAEVTFETQAGRFRCHWSQRRAHRKPDGELQNPKHELADADSGKILEAKLRGVAGQIEETTGMDFDRFTRSMLLAQGGFAVFLQAAPDDRAPILEQITGTEIYSRISIRVHERRSEERRKLDLLLAELAGMQPLSEEDESSLGNGLEHRTRQDEELIRRIARRNLAIAWLDGVARLEVELQQVAEQNDDLLNRIGAFAPEQEKLGRAVQALELSGEHAALSSLRNAQEADRRSLAAAMEVLPGCERAAAEAREAVMAAGETLATRKAEQQTAAPVIRSARELDLKIREKEAPIRDAGESMAAREKDRAALRSRHKRDSADLAERRTTLDALLRQLEETKADEGLVEQLAGIRERFDLLTRLHGQLGGKLTEAGEAEGQLKDAATTWKKKAASLETLKSDLGKGQDSLDKKLAELRNILEGRELAAWRTDMAALAGQHTLLVKAGEAARSLAGSSQALDELGKRHEALAAEGSALKERLQSQTARQAQLEKETGLLETQLSLLKRIEDLDEARHQLRDGEPCPLCGSMDHPFAEGTGPVPDETRRQLDAARSELKAVIDAVSGLMVRQAQVAKDLEHMASCREEHAVRTVEAQNLISQACAELALDAAGPGLAGRLEELLGENARKLDHATGVVQAAETREKELAKLRDSLDRAKEEVARAERDALDAVYRKDAAGQLLERLRKEAETLSLQQETSLSLLQKDVSAYGIESVAPDRLDLVLSRLTARRDQWLERHKERVGLDQMISALEIQTRHQADQIRKSDDELEIQRELLNGLTRDREDLCRERRELFGDRLPDDEEQRLAAATGTAEKALEAAREKLNTANQELGRLQSGIESLEKSLTTRDAQLQAAGEAFLARLAGVGFADEDDFTAACLPEDERRSLAERSRQLADEKSGLASKERDKTALLEAERQKNVTDQPRDELNRELEILVANQKELQQEIGAIRQKLRDNEELKKDQQERALAIEAQNRECSRWDQLHQLIGSADGKKYRNFAQGLTFEMMIGHANRQLRKMSDRYLLIRDDAQPLELNVVDNYQAGEIRSTKNLSGGESFIVSLSLALGLSHMASRNVRVDSLFLDEGFGTLDEEALDTALETLAGLQQDGKMIGVISHVGALKERISTRIQVTPQTGGRSLISGPGVRHA